MVRFQFLARLVAAAAALTMAPVGQGSTRTPSDRQGTRPVVSIGEAPVGTETQAVQWVKIAVPGVGVMIAAVARPQGAGPFPAILILHGSHGFAQQYVQLAQAMARAGMLAVAACWFAGGRGAGSHFITRIECPEAPAVSEASSPVALESVDALVQAIHSLPDARPNRVALFGHSRGGGAVLNYILLGTGTVQAAVLNSAGYPGELAKRAPEIKVPILMLHGTSDSPDDGGSTFTNVQMARGFEAALRRAGAPVETKYYDGGRHNGLFSSTTQYDDEVQRMTAFLKRHLFK